MEQTNRLELKNTGDMRRHAATGRQKWGGGGETKNTVLPNSLTRGERKGREIVWGKGEGGPTRRQNENLIAIAEIESLSVNKSTKVGYLSFLRKEWFQGLEET